MKPLSAAAALLLCTAMAANAQVIRVPLTYHAPDGGPKPNFSPKGTQVPLTPAAADLNLPMDAGKPAKTGVIKIGPNERTWIPVLATADAAHPSDLCRVYIDRNRNGRFDDDGPALVATPAQNAKTKAWWTSIDSAELSIPYPGAAKAEPYMVSIWLVREGDAAPDVLRYSVRSWREGTIRVNGVEALVAAMDGDNNGVFDKDDYWSVLEASAPDAAKALSYSEARPTSRLMFVKSAAREQVLEFRRFSPDGRSIEFAVVKRPSTKAADRAGDDVLATERGRPRTTAPVKWSSDLTAALAQAKASGRRVLIDFEASWCGPCKTMDEWIWTDAEVADALNTRYVGVKLDGDVEKALTGKFKVEGYPTMIVLDPSGREATRAVGYLSSAQALALLAR